MITPDTTLSELIPEGYEIIPELPKEIKTGDDVQQISFYVKGPKPEPVSGSFVAPAGYELQGIAYNDPA